MLQAQSPFFSSLLSNLLLFHYSAFLPLRAVARVGSTYPVLLFCSILLDVTWFILFSHEIWLQLFLIQHTRIFLVEFLVLHFYIMYTISAGHMLFFSWAPFYSMLPGSFSSLTKSGAAFSHSSYLYISS